MLNAPLMLFVYALLPNEVVRNGTNILSILADKVLGRWFRIILVVDGMLVLGGGVLTGLFTTCGLIDRLARSLIFAFSKMRG